MHALSSTQQKALLVLLLLAGSVGAFIVLFMYITTLHERLDQQRVAAQAAAEQAKTEQAMEALVTESASDRQELTSYLLSTEDPTIFLSLVESLGSDAGVALEVKSITPETGQAATKDASALPPSIKVMLSAEGSWDGIYHLISLLETMPYVTHVETASIEEEETSEGARVWKGQIQMRVFTRS